MSEQTPTPSSQQPAVSLPDFGFGHILGAAALLIIPLGLFAPKALALLFGLVAVAGLVLHLKQVKHFPHFMSPVFYGFLALSVCVSTSLFWTISFDGSRTMAWTLPLTLFAGLLLVSLSGLIDERGQRFLEATILIAAISGLGLIALEVFTGGLLHRVGYYLKSSEFVTGRLHLFIVNNGATTSALLFWPTVLILWKRNWRLAAYGLSAIALVVFYNSWSTASIVSIIIGLAAAGLAFSLHRWIHWVLAGVFAIAVLGGPFIMQAIPDGRVISQNLPGLPSAVYPRIIIWQFTADLAMNKPLLGHGIRTSRFLSPEGGQIPYYVGKGGNRLVGATKAIPLHPHNGPLQVWLELGGIGAVIGLTILLTIIGAIKRLNISRSLQAICYGHLTAAFVIGSVTYGLWQGWWQGVLWLTTAMTIAILPSDAESAG